jgi:hypothetical protein
MQDRAEEAAMAGGFDQNHRMNGAAKFHCRSAANRVFSARNSAVGGLGES